MSDTLSPAAMAAVAGTSRAAMPRAVRHFGLAAMEARAARTRAAVAPPAPALSADPFQPPPGPAYPAAPARRVKIRLWVPLTAIFLVLSPFALLLAPLLYLNPTPYRVRPFPTVIGVGRVLLSLGGTLVQVDTPDALISIRIF